MSLLAAEAATNAMKYVDAREGTAPWIRVTFKACEDKTCVFRFENSARVNDTAGSTGMGARLINAFAIQLGATIEVPTLDGDPVRLRVAPGTPSGRGLRVKGRGVTTPKGTGDLLATVQVAVPAHVSAESTKKLREFADTLPAENPRDDLIARARG